jgi:cyclase
MSLALRLIACLDVRGARVVKGERFRKLRDVGDPVELAAGYESDGADEIVFLDVSASAEERTTVLDVVRRTAERLFIPLTVGGGVRTADDVAAVLRAGADRVSINTAAVSHPKLISDAARRFGRQCVVVSIDAKRRAAPREGWDVYTHGGRRRQQLDAVSWARLCAWLGAGEILLTSIDRDGGGQGYDIALTRAVSQAVSVPVIASGGAGSADDVVGAIVNGGAGAALVAGILHSGQTTVARIKERMSARGVLVRSAARV